MGLPGKVRVVQPTMAANLVDAYFMRLDVSEVLKWF